MAAKDRDDTWGLYIGTVAGKDYNKEAAAVIVNGSGMPDLRVADVYFPDLTRNLTTKWMKQDHFWDAEQFDASLKSNFEALERTGSIPHIAPDIIGIEPIDRHVLLVAAEVEPDRWVAFIGAVEGKDFEKEAAGVMVNGSQIPFELAEIFFEDEARNSSLKYRLKSKPDSG